MRSLTTFWQFLKQLEQPKEVTPAALAAAMEAVASLWHIHSPALVLLPEDRRIGDAFARLLGELAATEQPPRSVVHEAAAWLAEKLGVFTDEFAKAAGSFTGKTAALGAGVGLAWATGKAGDLANAVRNLWEMVR